MDLIFTYHPAWIFLALAISIGYSLILYRRDELLLEVSSKIKLMLAVFRFASVFFVAFLILGVILENFLEKKEKPLVFVAHDCSESIIQTKDSTFYKTNYTDELTELSEGLSEKFDVVTYSFSNGISDGISSVYDGKLTNTAQVFDQIYGQYANRNIGAVILSTDGVYNFGANPIYAVDRKKYVPVYTVGLGDTTEVKDCKVEEVFNNDIAFLGNQFPVEVSVSQNQFKGSEISVTIYQGEKEVAKKEIGFSHDREQIKVGFNLKATKIGFVKYTAKIEELKGEFTYKNNVSIFYVDVIDGRQKIALTYSGIHPDLSAISYVIDNNKNYEVDLVELKDLRDFRKYDLIICHNYKSGNSKFDEVIKSGSKPVLYIVGPNADIQNLGKMNVGFSGNANKSEDIGFAPNGKFNTIVYPPSVSSLLINAPPLKSPFGNLKYSSSLNVLAYQKIGNITLDQPLLYFSEKNNTKYGVVMGEGFWRWRLFDQSQNNSTDNFELLISKMITYLAVKENKSPFKVHVKNEYNESDEIDITAELYNESYDLVNDSEVEFTLKNENDKAFEYHFFKTSNAYKLELGNLSQGVYSWEAKTILSGKNYTVKGIFIVKEINVEWLNVTANHRLLRNLSQNTNGEFFLPNQLNDLRTSVLNRDDIVTVVYKEKSFKDLIDYKWLFFVIVLLLSVEWFIRKYNGAY